MENAVKVAIVGLGRVGSRFIEKITEFEGKGITIIAAVETNPDSPGIDFAKEKGLRIYNDVSRITEMGDKVDVIFDLTGNRSVERNMRLAQVRSGNTHTVIVPRIVAVLIWNLISEGVALPEHTQLLD